MDNDKNERQSIERLNIENSVKFNSKLIKLLSNKPGCATNTNIVNELGSNIEVDDDEEEEDDDDEDEDEDQQYDEGENNKYSFDMRNESGLNDFDELIKLTERNKPSMENLTDSTNKYLNMLGEDLLMEEQDILKSESKSAAFVSMKQNMFNIDLIRSHRIAESTGGQNDFVDFKEIRKLNTENQTFLDPFMRQGTQKGIKQEATSSKYEPSRSELINLIEQMNRTIELERFDKLKLKDKYNSCVMENKKCLSLLEQYNVEREEIVKEFNSLKAAKLKEAKRYNLEIEAISREYSQVMSERDSVHKEMEAMQEQLSKAQDRLKKYTRESTLIGSNNNILNMSSFGANMSTNYNENLNDLINNTINNSQRQQKCNSLLYESNMGSMDQALEIDSLKQQLNLIMRQRDEAIIQVIDFFFSYFFIWSTQIKQIL